MGSFGLGGPVPRDMKILLGVVFVTYSLQFFGTTAGLLDWLRLTPAVWRWGAVWQLVTYPFVGWGGASLWFLLELLILYWFGKDVCWRLGRRFFWKTILFATVGASVVAVATQLLFGLLDGFTGPQPFVLMQGQRMLIVILIAAFATLFADATILLFFVLPVRAAWFLWIELLFAFIGFLGTRDLAGFLGISAAVGITWSYMRPGGLRHVTRTGWLRMRERWIRYRLDRMRKQRQMRVVPGGGRGAGADEGPDEAEEPRRGPWVN